jgi:hypothetical protein
LVPQEYPRAAFLREHSDLLDPCLQPIYNNKGIDVRADATWALPGFYVLGYDEQRYRSLDTMDDLMHLRSFFIIKKLREGMREKLNINFLQLLYEEKKQLKSLNMHYWLMPTEDRNTKETHSLYDLNVRKYLKRFDFKKEKRTILEYNFKMKEYLSAINLTDQDNKLIELLANYERIEK